MRTWTLVFLHWIKDCILVVVKRARSRYNLVIVSATMDGISSGSLKTEGMGMFLKGEKKIRMFLIELKEFQYDQDDEEKKVKTNQDSFEALLNAFTGFGIIFEEITAEMMNQLDKPIPILRNVCLDGLYFNEKAKEGIHILENRKYWFKSEHAIDYIIQNVFHTTPLLEPCPHDPIHGVQLDVNKAKKTFPQIRSMVKVAGKGMHIQQNF